MSPRAKKVKVGPIGTDIDLDKEEVYLANGERLTEARAEQLVAELQAEHRRSAGRPSVTGRTEHTPNLTVRVAPATRAKLQEIAAAQGRRLADVTRDALDEYLARHAS